MTRMFAFLMLAAGVVACGGGDEAETSPPATLEEAMEQATQVIQQQTGDVEPVSAEKLQSRLPEEVDGLARTGVERAESGAMGMKMSMTTAEYEGTEGRRASIVISDLGGLGMGAMSAAAWSMTEFDRTTSSGFERTVRFDGLKAMESQSSAGGYVHTELNILVGQRFLVQVKGRNVELDALRDAARALDLRDLAGEG